jgi:glycerol-3-phosphate O-acyltransferase
LSAAVEVPLWLLLFILLLAFLALLDRLLVPSARWVIRQRTNKVLEEINTRLKIELQPFHKTKRQVLIDRLLYDPKVIEAAEAFAKAEGMPREVVMARAEHYAKEIVPAFNAYLYFRLGYAMARRVARLLYRVRLGYSDEEGLARIEKGATVVFVMNHRSNMDYIIVGFLAADRAALSYAVGEWARIWPLRTLVRSLGGYFVRRDSRDDLYRRVLERYIVMATAAGVTQALYPEGGLSKDGALREPKLGVLHYMLREFDPEGPRDLVFVPVGINYDRTLEDRTLLLGLDPGAPQKGKREGKGKGKGKGKTKALVNTGLFTARNFSQMAFGRWHRFGYACVNFGAPLSMREAMRRRGVDPRKLPKEERAELVSDLGRRLMEAVGEVVPVLPVSLVATVLLADPGKALGEFDLKGEAHALIERLEARGYHVYIPRQDREYAIAVGLRMLTLRNLVEEKDGLFKPVPEELPLLRYYANAIAHLVRSEE